MKVDTGFWNKDGKYIESIEELTMEEEIERLQAENERLDNKAQDYYNTIMKLNDLVKELSAENERLKALCDTYFTCYRAKHNDIDGNLFSYRKTLEEIREIASAIINGKHITNDIEGHLKELNKQIIDKINEVLNER